MFRHLVLSSILLVSSFPFQAKGECDISGIWNHTAKPAKLYFDLDKAEVTVYSHDSNRKAIGLVVLKALMPTSNPLLWNAKMYSAAEDSYVDVRVTLTGCHQLAVSFNGEEVLALVR